METPVTKSRAEAAGGSFPLEIAAVCCLFALVALGILVTYSRVPPAELYHVSQDGIAGGLGRAVVFSNFPLALVSIPILALLGARLGSRMGAAAVVGIVLSAAVYWPGVVRESNLDVREVNAIAALGALVAVALTLVAAFRLEPAPAFVRQRGDTLRIVLAAVVLLLGVPWAAADAGLHLDGVPVLGAIFQTGALRSQPDVVGLHPAVHLGHHHGMDGVLLVLSALLLSRVLPSLRAGWLRYGVGAYLALMLCYGLGNVANDAWTEQIVKRGWTSWSIPDVTTPHASAAWLVIVGSSAALFVVSVTTTRPTPAAAGRRVDPERA